MNSISITYLIFVFSKLVHEKSRFHINDHHHITATMNVIPHKASDLLAQKTILQLQFKY